MTVYAKLVYPLRSLSFFSVYLVINSILYNRESVIRKHFVNKFKFAPLSSPSLQEELIRRLEANINSFPESKTYMNSILGWTISADVCLVFLFICMILGLLTNKPHQNFVIAFLHFISVILCTNLIVYHESINFLICAVVFGIFLPTIIEIVNMFSILVFKTDYYVQSN